MKKLTNYLILALALVAGAGLASSCGKDYGDDISKLDKRVAAIEQQNLAEVKSQLNQLSSTLNGITGTLSSVQSKNGELEGLVNGLSSTVGSLQSTISGLVSISDFNEFKSSYETEKGELSGQLGTITRTLETLSGKVGDAATKSELDSLNTELGGRIQGLSEKLDAMGLKLDALQASIRSVVFVPDYSDGKVVVPAPVNVVKLTYDIQPAAAAKTFAESFAAGKATATYVARTLKTRTDGPSATVSSISNTSDGQIVVSAKIAGMEEGTSTAIALVLTDEAGNSIQSDYAIIEIGAKEDISVELGGVTYKAARMADGRVWMTEPLRFVPEGKTVSANPGDGSGIWYPYTVDGVAETTEEAIKERGYLYDYATAFGVEEVNAENYQSFEGTQGICPDGWYIPTKEDFFGLVGNGPAASTYGPAKTDAPYYDSQYEGGRITTLDEAGFGWTFSGVINRTAASATGKYMTVKTTAANCSVESYRDKVSMTFLMGSTANPKITASSGNIQFAGLMSTFTGKYPEGRLSVSWSNYLSGYPLRCIRKD